MVWLTKWILENITGARVLIITDREELDNQIEKIFTGVDLQIARSKSSDDLLNLLNNYDSRLMCSLIHKFGRRTGEVSDLDYEKYVEELKKTIPADFSVKDKVFVFVDECHRTNSGKLHLAMKSIMPDSVFIGFTGTPLLKLDKEQKTTATLFGGFIHTYKFDQAVRDGVVLDLRYEARNVPQEVRSKDKIDGWFEAKTKGLMPKAVAALKEKWATLQQLYSSKEQQEKYNGLVKEYVDLKDEIGLSSGDFIDLKQYDSAMRHLIDNHISASDSEKLGYMENFTLLAYIQKKQEEDLKNGNSKSDKKHKSAQQNVAETIENNIRRKIIEKTPVNPKYYQKMSELFQTLIDERKEEIASYKEMLEKYAGLVIQVEKPEQNNSHPESIRTSLALCVLYDNFGEDEEYALALHKAVLDTKQDHFRGDLIKERQIKGGIYRVVQKYMNKAERDEQMATVEKIYEIVKEQAEY